MKRLLVLCLALMALASWGRVEITKSIYDTTYKFEVEKVNVANTKLAGQNFSKLSLVGVDGFTGIHYERGLPEIPVISFYVFADSEQDVQVYLERNKSAQDEVSALSHEIVPSQDSLAKIKGAKVPFVKLSLDKGIGYWPEAEYNVQFAGSIKGKAKWLVTLYPVSYNTAMPEYKLIKNFEVKVLNPAQVKAKEEAKKDAMVFVVGKNFKSAAAVKKYAAFKTQMGLVVKTIVFGEDVTDDVTLRKAIQAVYRDPSLNLKYAFIIGDIEDVGSHKAANLTVGVTDHYFRAIDTDNYDADMNGPDIGVGRITPKTEAELNKIIDKFIKYQTGVFANEEWLKHPAFVATDDRYQIAEGSHNYVIDTYTSKLNYTGVFPNNPQIGGDKLYAITHKVSNPTVVSTLKSGRFIIDYSGHGATTYWAGPTVTQDDVRSIGQTDAYPFVIGNACITGQFTIPESFGETWIKNSAIMYWGSMDSSYWDEDDILERAMANRIFSEGVREFGDFTNYALSEVWKKYQGANRSKYYWETYVTFGDPSIHLRANASKNLVIDGQTEIAYGEDSANFTVTTESGAPVSNAQVSLTLGERIISTAKTNNAGQVVMSIAGADVGSKLALTVMADDARMLTKEVLITSTSNPYLILGNYTANGVVTSELRPFDLVRINFIVKNVAKVATKGAQVVLEAVEGPAQIVSSKASIPALQAGQVYTLDGAAFQIKMLDASLCDKVTLKFRWTTSEGDTKLVTQSYRIKRGELTVSAVDFGDAQNPDNGGFGPGETGKIFITVTNTGNDKIVNAKLSPVANKCIATMNGNIAIPALNPGESVRVAQAINVKLNTECANDAFALFDLRGAYQGIGSLGLAAQGQFVVGRYGTFEFNNPALDLAVPDQGEIALPFEVKNVNVLKNLNLNIKITHTYIGDIVINLVAPDGTTVNLRNNQGGGDDNLDLTLDADFPPFQTIYGKNAVGTWKLIFKDTAKSDTGKVDSVKMKFKGFI